MFGFGGSLLLYDFFCGYMIFNAQLEGGKASIHRKETKQPLCERVF